MLKKLKDYVIDNKLKINIFDDKLNIVNYIDLVTIETEKICVSSENKNIIIKGTDLTLNKLLEKEVLISGNIKSIELE